MPERVSWGTINEVGIQGGNERCIELPLALEFMALDTPGRVLDAGCALNGHLPPEHAAQVFHLSQSLHGEARPRGNRVTSYIAFDIRGLRTLFAEEAFNRGVCISTLEHIGMNNEGYGGTVEHCPESQELALYAFDWVCEDWLITVPYRSDPVDHRKWIHWGAKEVNRTLQKFHGSEARYWALVDGLWVGGGTSPLIPDDDRHTDKVHQIVAIRRV